MAWLPHRVPTVAVGDDPIEAAYHNAGETRWTPDLVHCRLADAGRVLKRLQSPAKPGLGMVWRQLAPASADVPPPAEWEITLCWWTIDQVTPIEATNRVIAFGFMVGLS